MQFGNQLLEKDKLKIPALFNDAKATGGPWSRRVSWGTGSL